MSAGSATPRPFTPLVNAQDTEQKIKDEILRHWKDIQRNCRQADPDNTGNISQGDFKCKSEGINKNCIGLAKCLLCTNAQGSVKSFCTNMMC